MPLWQITSTKLSNSATISDSVHKASWPTVSIEVALWWKRQNWLFVWWRFQGTGVCARRFHVKKTPPTLNSRTWTISLFVYVCRSNLFYSEKVREKVFLCANNKFSKNCFENDRWQYAKNVPTIIVRNVKSIATSFFSSKRSSKILWILPFAYWWLFWFCYLNRLSNACSW